MQSTIKDLYLRLRKNGMSASRAYTEAKNRHAAGVEWWNIPARGAIEYNQASADGARWVEHAATGLRLVGFADEVATRNYNYAYGVDHKGWYTDEDGARGTLRGIVYQLPARKGKPVYIIGYTESENFEETGGARLDFSSLYYGEKGGVAEGASYDSDARNAARHADKMAESAAEKEREYNEAYDAGRDYEYLGEQLSSERKATLELIRDMKAQRARGATPAICNALAGVIKSSLREIARLKEKRAQLVDDFSAAWRAEVWPAFNEGAGETIFKAA